jgi:hypothetical protein
MSTHAVDAPVQTNSWSRLLHYRSRGRGEWPRTPSLRCGASGYLSQRQVVDREVGLAFGQRAVVGHVACLVSRALAIQIAQPDVWRIAALVSTARLLTPWTGLNAAAIASASSARQFQKEVTKGISPLDWRIMKSASDAVSGNGGDAMATASANIAARLKAETPAAEGWAARALQGSNKSFWSGA